MKRTIGFLLSLFFILFLGACSGSGTAPAGEKNITGIEYPNRPITLVVPYGAGGTTDLTARQFAKILEKKLGQTVVVVNQPGASGVIGTKTVLDAEPDGYTLLFTADSLGTQRVMGLSEFSYDDFQPVMAVVDDPKVIVVNKNAPYQTLDDLVQDMKMRKDKVKMSYTGPGGSGHVQSLIYGTLGLNMSLTAYSSGSECILAVLGNQVDFTNSNFSTVKGYIESGDLRVLAVSTRERLAEYPEVPTFLEKFPEAENYFAMPFTPLSIVAEKDMPSEIVDILRSASKEVVKETEWKNYVKSNHLTALYEIYPQEKEILSFYKEWQSRVCWLLWDSGVAPNSPQEYGIERLE